MSDHGRPDQGDLVSFLTLAAQLDTDPRTVMLFARELNMPANDLTFLLTPEQAETVTEFYRLTNGTLWRDKPVERIDGFTPGTTTPEHDPEMARWEDLFGVAANKRHDYQPGAGAPRTPPRPRPAPRTRPRPRPAPPAPLQRTAPPTQPRPPIPPEPELTVLPAEIVRVRPTTTARSSIAVAQLWNQQWDFSEADTVAWLENGLDPNKADLAKELAGYGVRPHHLSLVVRRETVLVRLRDGRLTPWWIADLLKREKLLGP